MRASIINLTAHDDKENHVLSTGRHCCETQELVCMDAWDDIPIASRGSVKGRGNVGGGESSVLGRTEVAASGLICLAHLR